MYYNNNFPDNFFARGHRALTWGTVFFGGLLFLLAMLIFAYPALIAYFIAVVILFAGLSALAVGWKLWKLRNEVTKLDTTEDDRTEPFHFRSLGTNRTHHVTYIRW